MTQEEKMTKVLEAQARAMDFMLETIFETEEDNDCPEYEQAKEEHETERKALKVWEI